MLSTLICAFFTAISASFLTSCARTWPFFTRSPSSTRSSATRPSASDRTLTSASATRLAVELMYAETAPRLIGATLTGTGAFSLSSAVPSFLSSFFWSLSS